MIKEVTNTEMFTKVEELNNQKILEFIDGEGFDRLLQFVLKGLYCGMIFFCIPFLIYLISSL